MAQLLLVQEALSQNIGGHGQVAHWFSKVLGKPINQADLRGVGVAYSRWEQGEANDTRKCCRRNTDQARLQFVSCGSLGLARGCLVDEPALNYGWVERLSQAAIRVSLVQGFILFFFLRLKLEYPQTRRFSILYLNRSEYFPLVCSHFLIVNLHNTKNYCNARIIT